MEIRKSLGNVVVSNEWKKTLNFILDTFKYELIQSQFSWNIFETIPLPPHIHTYAYT